MLGVDQADKCTWNMFVQEALRNGSLHHELDGCKKVRICHRKTLLMLLCSVVQI